MQVKMLAFIFAVSVILDGTAAHTIIKFNITWQEWLEFLMSSDRDRGGPSPVFTVIGGKKPIKTQPILGPWPAPATKPNNLGTVQVLTKSDLIADKVLKEHNRLRAFHGALPLTLSREMSRSAQKYAENLVRLGTLKHSSREERNGAGENLAWRSGGITDDEETAVGMADLWYKEITDYTFQTGGCRSGAQCGHLTQLLWDDSERIGVGYAKTSDGIEAYLVVRYDPPGNYRGQYPKHVAPIVAGKSMTEILETLI